MHLHVGRWHITAQRHTPTPRLDALLHDELMVWAGEHLRNRARRQVTIRHHKHRHTTAKGNTAVLEFDDKPTSYGHGITYGGYTHISRGQPSTVDVSMCPTCRP